MSFDPPPLPPFQPPWGSFQVWWQQVLGGLKTELGALDAALAAQADALAALTAANAAQTAADTVQRDDAITASYTAPGSVLSAADAGSNSTITIANHKRVYGQAGDFTNVTGGSLTGAAYSTVYYIYYDDATRNDTTPTYKKTTNANTALPNNAVGRHYVGKVTTPASGGADTSGGTSAPAGGGGIDRSELTSTL